MDVRFTTSEESFRAQLRAWLEANMPAQWRMRPRHPHGGEIDEADELLLRHWQHTLYEGGWAGISWPQEYGGRGATAVERVIYDEEMARAKAPSSIALVGQDIVGPVLMLHGTPEQKSQFLPRILSGDEVWCQGFSEPNAGSDLASLQTQASQRGDEFVITGTKIWTSFAHLADWCLLLARTDPTAPKHRGITCFAVDMHDPRIAVQPLTTLAGTHEFNEVHFDEVVVRKERVIGTVNQGWNVAVATLSQERSGLGLAFSAVYDRYFREVVQFFLAQPGEIGAEQSLLQQRMARSYVDLTILKWNGYRAAGSVAARGHPGPEASVGRLQSGLVSQELMRWAADVLQPFGESDDPDRDQYWSYGVLRARANTIGAGTAEVQRNVIARRVLGMPA